MECEHVMQSSDFKDHKTGLVVFGILQIIFGAVTLLSMFFVMIHMIVSPNRNDDPESLPSITSLLFAVFANYLMAAWNILTGIGSIKARRWARTLILASSWINLIWTICGFILFLLIAPFPKEVYKSMIVSGLLTTIPTVIIFGVFILFYNSRNVKATCLFRDSQIRWNDKYPWLVVTAILLFAILAVSTGLASMFGIL